MEGKSGEFDLFDKFVYAHRRAIIYFQVMELAVSEIVHDFN